MCFFLKPCQYQGSITNTKVSDSLSDVSPHPSTDPSFPSPLSSGPTSAETPGHANSHLFLALSVREHDLFYLVLLCYCVLFLVFWPHLFNVLRQKKKKLKAMVKFPAALFCREGIQPIDMKRYLVNGRIVTGVEVPTRWGPLSLHF